MQAAVLAHCIAESQAFSDANKRLALVAMLTFLEINGMRVEASDPELAAWILDFSTGATPANSPHDSARDCARSNRPRGPGFAIPLPHT